MVLQVSFIYFIVDKIIVLLSELFIDGSPCKYNCDWFTGWFKLSLCRTSFTSNKGCSLNRMRGTKLKNDLCLQMTWLQWKISEGVSLKLYHQLWPFKGRKLNLDWKRYRTTTGSWILKQLLDSGLIKDIIPFVSTTIYIDGIFLYLKISIKKSKKQWHLGRNYSCILLHEN